MSAQGSGAVTPAFTDASARAAIRALRGLEQTAIMLEKYAAECFPILPEHEGKMHFVRAIMEAAAQEIRDAWRAAIAEVEAFHAVDDPAAATDNDGVERLAIAMKLKLAAKRTEGRGGWDDPSACPVEDLAQMLIDHLPKGDPVDVANFAMMLFNREGGEALAEAWADRPGGAA